MGLFRSSEATARIADLEKQLADSTKATKAAEDAAIELEKENATLKGQLDAAKSATNPAAESLKAEQAKTSKLETEKADLAKQLAAVDQKAIDERVEKLASARALEIAARQGAAPIPSQPSAKPGSPAAGKDLTGIDRAIATHKAETHGKSGY